jgi:hypothetical protein
LTVSVDPKFLELPLFCPPDATGKRRPSAIGTYLQQWLRDGKIEPGERGHRRNVGFDGSAAQRERVCAYVSLYTMGIQYEWAPWLCYPFPRALLVQFHAERLRRMDDSDDGVDVFYDAAKSPWPCLEQ